MLDQIGYWPRHSSFTWIKKHLLMNTFLFLFLSKAVSTFIAYLSIAKAFVLRLGASPKPINIAESLVLSIGARSAAYK
jgi:hypothetical protein